MAMPAMKPIERRHTTTSSASRKFRRTSIVAKARHYDDHSLDISDIDTKLFCGREAGLGPLQAALSRSGPGLLKEAAGARCLMHHEGRPAAVSRQLVVRDAGERGRERSFFRVVVLKTSDDAETSRLLEIFGIEPGPCEAPRDLPDERLILGENFSCVLCHDRKVGSSSTLQKQVRSAHVAEAVEALGGISSSRGLGLSLAPDYFA